MSNSESETEAELKKRIAELEKELKAANNTIRRAKDIGPVERPSFKRVVKLVLDACMTLRKVVGGWILKLGTRVRRFKRLSQIWELLMVDEWFLSEIFPPEPERHYRHCVLKPRPILRKMFVAQELHGSYSDRTLTPTTS